MSGPPMQAVSFDLDGTLDIDPSEDTAAWGADGEAHAPAGIVHWLRSWTV